VVCFLSQHQLHKLESLLVLEALVSTLGRMFGLFGTAFTAGNVLAPIVATWIYDKYRFTMFNVAGIQVPSYGILFY